MKRWGLIVALLLSVGLNVGVLATLAVTARPSPELAPEPIPDAPFPPRSGPPAEPSDAHWESQRRFMRELAGERFEVEALRRELRTELVADRPDRERIGQLLAELSRRSAVLEQRFVEHVLATRAQLGPVEEQRFLEMLRRIPELRQRGPHPDRRYTGPPAAERERRWRPRQGREPERPQ